MKYLIVLTDGASDRPIPALDGKTPLQAANLSTINRLAQNAEIGTCKSIPHGMSPGSDIANLSVMGYDPKIYHTGRSPLEAVSMGIEMSPTDVAFRCNIVTLTEEGEPYEEKTIIDHSSGDISSEEAAILIKDINKALGTDSIQFFPGVSYRHAMIVDQGSTDFVLTPPHDILTQKITDYLPKENEATGYILDLMKKSWDILVDHPVNKARKERGLHPANTLWIWGQGRKPKLSSFYDKYGVKGTVISAVDLIKGIGLCAGLTSVDVEGATGTLHTNYKGKADAAIKAFEDGSDFVYIHIEAPDECAHQGDMNGKIKCLEDIDQKIVNPLYTYLEKSGEPFKILVVPDHPTPLEIRTHSSEPVPFVLYDSTRARGISKAENAYNEVAAQSGLYFNTGYELTDYFFTGK